MIQVRLRDVHTSGGAFRPAPPPPCFITREDALRTAVRLPGFVTGGSYPGGHAGVRTRAGSDGQRGGGRAGEEPGLPERDRGGAGEAPGRETGQSAAAEAHPFGHRCTTPRPQAVHRPVPVDDPERGGGRRRGHRYRTGEAGFGAAPPPEDGHRGGGGRRPHRFHQSRVVQSGIPGPPPRPRRRGSAVGEDRTLPGAPPDHVSRPRCARRREREPGGGQGGPCLPGGGGGLALIPAAGHPQRSETVAPHIRSAAGRPAQAARAGRPGPGRLLRPLPRQHGRGGARPPPAGVRRVLPTRGGPGHDQTAKDGGFGRHRPPPRTRRRGTGAGRSLRLFPSLRPDRRPAAGDRRDPPGHGRPLSDASPPPGGGGFRQDGGGGGRRPDRGGGGVPGGCHGPHRGAGRAALRGYRRVAGRRRDGAPGRGGDVAARYGASWPGPAGPGKKSENEKRNARGCGPPC